jgi:Tol biopolymer transport system component
VTGSSSGPATNAVVGSAYDNGKIAFTINDGTVDFIVGDRFTVTDDVTSLSYNVGSYAWSPVDPTKIAFVMQGFAHIASVDRVDVHALVLANVATERAVRLYDIPAGFSIGQLVWSPVGNMLAVECGTTDADEICVLDVSVSPAVVTNITNNSARDGSPTWSPDGKKIAFVSDRGGNDDIYVMDANGANVKRVTTNPASDSNPRWRP